MLHIKYYNNIYCLKEPGMEVKMDKNKKQKLFNIIMENINEGIQVIDENGKTILYNKKMSDIEEMNNNKLKDENLSEKYPFLVEEYNTDKMKYSIPINFNDGTIWTLKISRDINDLKILYKKINKLELQNKKNENNSEKACFTFTDIIGENKKIKKLKKQAMKAARTDSSILIVGDTGTGKELFAQSIHNASIRKKKPFIAQNCAALPENLLEGILFGTRKGGFTGAIDREGLFEQANKGTLLLDEINSMSFNLQAKLLRVLEEGLIRPIGSKEYISVNVRIIATINTPPAEAIRNNKLRADLYYRLAVVLLYLPLLCERKDDIMLLTSNFIERYNNKFNLNVCKISDEVKDIFYNYSWPGNIRQLKHLIEGIMNLIDNEKVIKRQHIEPFLININKESTDEISIDEESTVGGQQYKKESSLPERLDDIEKDIIIKTLEETRYNVTEAAKMLGIKRQSLQYRMEKYDIR
jgi:arginine utilization regulatory protein